MAIRVMKYMWDYRLPDSIPSRQKSTAKLVLLKLGDNSNDEGYCWPSIDRIAHECDLSYRSVSRVLSELESAEVIKRVPRYTNGVRTSNGYWINIRKLQEESSPYEMEDKQSIDNPFEKPEGHQVRQCETSSPLVSDVMTYKPPVTIKEPSNTDISHSDERIVFLEDIKHEYQLTFCQDAINELELINNKNYTRKSYTGALKISEWEECESAMRSVDCFDTEYFTWWMETRSQSMRKTPSLPNMLTDMNGTPFDQFYDSTFMQGWE